MSVKLTIAQAKEVLCYLIESNSGLDDIQNQIDRQLKNTTSQKKKTMDGKQWVKYFYQNILDEVTLDKPKHLFPTRLFSPPTESTDVIIGRIRKLSGKGKGSHLFCL